MVLGCAPPPNNYCLPTPLVACNHSAFRNTKSSGRKKRRISLLLGNNDKRTISGIQTTVLRTLQPQSMFQNLGISCKINRTLRLLQNNRPVRRRALPLFTSIHRKTQLYNVLPCENSHRMHHNPHSSTPTPTLRSLTGIMRTARSL